jgi:Na+/melibiose symporter-like transporter
MTPEQAARKKAISYAMIGAGIAVFIVAFQYAMPQTGRAEPVPVFVPFMFAGIGIVFFTIAGLMWRKASKQNIAPVAPLDLSGPQGKMVILWMVLGFAALAGSYYVDDLVPNDEILGMLLSMGLVVITIICFVTASRIARKIRNASTTGAVKE